MGLRDTAAALRAVPAAALADTGDQLTAYAEQVGGRVGPYRLTARPRVTGGPTATLTVAGTPAGPWVWITDGTAAHVVAPRRRRALRLAGASHPISGAVIHPGATGRGAWRKVAARATTSPRPSSPTTYMRPSMAERIEIIVTTDAADAAGTLDQLAAQVEEITGIKPEITVEAETDDASEGLDTVAEGADALDGTPAAVAVSAEGVDQAIADLESAATAAEGMGDAGVDASVNVKGAAKDMLRPLGLAKSSVGDLTDTFQLLADEAVDAMSLTEDQAGKLAGALPVIGVAIGLAVTAWQTYSKNKKPPPRPPTRPPTRSGRSATPSPPVTSKPPPTSSWAPTQTSSRPRRTWGSRTRSWPTTSPAPPTPSPASRAASASWDPTPPPLPSKRAAPARRVPDRRGRRRDPRRQGRRVRFRGARRRGGDGRRRRGGRRAGRPARPGQRRAGRAEGRPGRGRALDALETSTREAGEAAYIFGVNSEEASDANRTLTGDTYDARAAVADYTEEVGGIPDQTLTEILSLIDHGKINEAEALFNMVARPATPTCTPTPRPPPPNGS